MTKPTRSHTKSWESQKK